MIFAATLHLVSAVSEAECPTQRYIYMQFNVYEFRDPQLHVCATSHEQHTELVSDAQIALHNTYAVLNQQL